MSAHALFPEDQNEMRREYMSAAQALKKNNIYQFNKYKRRLHDYVLWGHLEYEYLKPRIRHTPKTTLQEFIETYDYTPKSDALRNRWLHYLARSGDWETFHNVFPKGSEIKDKKLVCSRLNNLLKTSHDQAPLMVEVEKLWLTGKRLPSRCNPVFKAWRKAGHMSSDLVWARIKLAMDKRQISLARSLKKYLKPKERIWVRRWEAVHWNPHRELTRINYNVETPVARMIVKHGIKRLAYRDPQAAMDVWLKLKKKHRFFGEDENYVLRWVGVLAAQRHMPEALDWLSSVSAESDDATLRVWRIKAALRAGEWQTARHFLGALTEEEAQEGEWRYWRARILEESGSWNQGEVIYAALANERSYYGFMAADRLDRDYVMAHKSIEATPLEVSAMLERPGIQAAYELYKLGQVVPARRQWNFITKQMNNRELQIAALVARQWGWYDRAIYTVTKSDHQDDLDIRFPVLYRDMVEANAKTAGIDTEWMYGIMRQESAFVEDARSHAGALGLMQLMPRTGRLVGRGINMRIRNNATILKIENNLKLGATYLKSVLRRKAGSQVLATASYNAGPHRVKKWLPKNTDLAADVWVETIPFNETRHYVKNVLGFTAVYEHRLGNEHTQLRERMPNVTPGK
ncbi:MAG: transglycosylase SLT domain-containing protein [Gammaproteobacteria bacterium]|nr:MAG: transglycosylase SLT domain-containing protein [Gammaproteobacteria bacterium]